GHVELRRCCAHSALLFCAAAALRRRCLGFFGHRGEILSGDLAYQLGMVGAHVRLDYRRRLLHGFTVSEEPALTPDHLRHDPLLLSFATIGPPACALLRFSLHRHWPTTGRLESS